MSETTPAMQEPIKRERTEDVLDEAGNVIGMRCFSDPPQQDSFDRHPGRTLILHISHPTLGDELFEPVIVDGLKDYLRRLECGESWCGRMDSIELPSGARLDAIFFGPGF